MISKATKLPPEIFLKSLSMHVKFVLFLFLFCYSIILLASNVKKKKKRLQLAKRKNSK